MVKFIFLFSLILGSIAVNATCISKEDALKKALEAASHEVEYYDAKEFEANFGFFEGVFYGSVSADSGFGCGDPVCDDFTSWGTVFASVNCQGEVTSGFNTDPGEHY